MTPSVKITHAVPEPVQRVLDAMTEENWQKGALGPGDAGKMCFLGHARHMGLLVSKKLDPLLLDEHLGPVVLDLNNRIERKFGPTPETFLPRVSLLNDTASSLSDFKQKIIELYRVEKQ